MSEVVTTTAPTGAKASKEKVDKPKKETGPSMAQFENFQSQVTAGFQEIANQLKVLVAQPAPAAAHPALLEGGPDDQTPIPASWRKAVLDILGPEFECEMVQLDSGGTKFKIVVPKHLSNAPQAYWEMHKRDVRTSEIGATGLAGVKEWCLKIRANLTASGIKLVQYP